MSKRDLIRRWATSFNADADRVRRRGELDALRQTGLVTWGDAFRHVLRSWGE